ncbi:conserved protein of unknown function [Hyphomicrobium sp. MC1]|nr:conserved protein of unknown function [Hyphomicrobium sp. MC1]
MRTTHGAKAAGLAGLSEHQLREWTVRRALIPPDVKPSGRGDASKFCWQTILVLRIAATLRGELRLELSHYVEMFAALRQALAGTSFLELWGKVLVIQGPLRWNLLDADDRASQLDGIRLALDPHLKVLATGFELASPGGRGQLEMFPAQVVHSPIGPSVSRGRRRA